MPSYLLQLKVDPAICALVVADAEDVARSIAMRAMKSMAWGNSSETTCRRIEQSDYAIVIVGMVYGYSEVMNNQIGE